VLNGRCEIGFALCGEDEAARQATEKCDTEHPFQCPHLLAYCTRRHRELGLADIGYVIHCCRDQAMVSHFDPTVNFVRTRTRSSRSSAWRHLLASFAERIIAPRSPKSSDGMQHEAEFEAIEERANKLGIKINLSYDFGSGRSDDAQ
jgi:hypothetical protein